MRYSANLNIIIKAIEKSTSYLSRDFMELENLQSNPISANKFALRSYNKLKEILVADFGKFRPEYNIEVFGEKTAFGKKDAEFSYVIFPIDGIENLARSNPNFTTAIALQHLNKDGSKETIGLAIKNVFSNELYYAEKGFGAYLNNRRIRVSRRIENDTVMVGDIAGSCNYGSKILEIAYLSSAKIDKITYDKKLLQDFRPFFLLVKEAGGKIEEDSNKIILGS